MQKCNGPFMACDWPVEVSGDIGLILYWLFYYLTWWAWTLLEDAVVSSGPVSRSPTASLHAKMLVHAILCTTASREVNTPAPLITLSTRKREEDKSTAPPLPVFSVLISVSSMPLNSCCHWASGCRLRQTICATWPCCKRCETYVISHLLHRYLAKFGHVLN